MNIKYFNNNDIKEASLLAKSYWGDLFTNEGDKLAELINELLVRYNILNSKYSYKLTLFISKQKGCGKLLMDGFMKKCRQDGLKNLFLWTDTTCNHQYYENNQFTLVARFKNSDTPGMEKHAETLIYKKEIK